jgi:hypothetical protein
MAIADHSLVMAIADHSLVMAIVGVLGMGVLLCCGLGAEVVMRFAAQKRILRLNDC